MTDIKDIKVLTIGEAISLPFNVVHVSNIRELFTTIASYKPDFIVSIGHLPTILNNREFAIRSKWMHFDKPNVDQITNAIRNTYEYNVYNEHRYASDWPLVSVYTATYNSGDYIMDAYASLREQTWGDWEWVVVDDCSTDGTYAKLIELSKLDYRVKPYQMPKSGKIGEVKGTAVKLCRGKYVVELDHDDYLTDTCLDEVRKGFCKLVDGKYVDDPEVGMVYTDFAEVMPDGSTHRYYGPPWEDKYQEVEYRDKKYLQAVGPDIYDGFSDYTMDRYAYYLTVGPNHARCYRRSKLMELGGYNPNLPVADDYDVYVRMFIHSKIVHIPKMLYIYRFHDHYSNTTFTRNKSIQDHLQIARNYYLPLLHKTNLERVKKDGFSYFTIIILSWNTKDLTKLCVDSAIKSLNGPYSEIIVLDQASSDGSVEMLREYRDAGQIRLIELEANVGFAAGCNIAASHVRRPETLKYSGSPNGHYLVFLNSDCLCSKEAVQNAISTLYFNDTIGIAGAWSNNTAFCVSETNTGNLPETDVPVVSGSFMVIRKSLFDEVHGFNTKYHNIWEDTDLCYKVRRLGLRTVVSANTWIYHKGHASFENAKLDADAIQTFNKPLFDKLNQRIAAVCIAKNEENCIAEWIAQWKGIVDQVVVFDTGSTDNTVNIAKSAGAKVVQKIYTPEDFSYAEARNLAISEAQSDWIVMLDCDERLDSSTLSNLRSIVSDAEDDILLIPILAVYPNGNNKFVIGRPCIFRNKSSIQWISRVHEKLIGSTKQAWLVNSVVIHRMGYHSDELRKQREAWYNSLQANEPFYTDKTFRARIEKEYPILDWHHPDDSRIARRFTGDLISIIMPTWKQPKLSRAIESVLSQIYTNWELIIVGDNCPQAQEIVNNYKDNRIRFFNLKTNHGAGGGVPRNFGLEYASSNIIAYLDDDNSWTPEHLQSLIKTMRETNSKFVFSSFKFEGHDIICNEPKWLRIDTSTIMHHKELVFKYGPWKTRVDGGYAHDWELVSRWVNGGEKWAPTKAVTMIYDNEIAQQPVDLILKGHI